MGVTEALHALAHGLQGQFMEWVEALAGQRQVPGWTLPSAVSWSVTCASR